MNEVIDVNNELEQKNIASQIVELETEMEALELKSKSLRNKLLDAMNNSGIKSIRLDCGMIVTKVERKDLKVDIDKCRTFLDSAGIYEEFSKIDESKIKKIYPTADFIEVGKPIEYIQIKKEK